MTVDAVAGLQRHDKDPANAYLAFVRRHRGRDIALETKARLVELARSRAFSECHRWPANNYKPTPIPKPYELRATHHRR